MMQRKKKILIVDDEKDFVQTLRDRLEFEGYATVAAYEGVRAIEAAHKEKPDLILLDIHMPAGKGSSVVTSLRSRAETQMIPILILTGSLEKALEQELLSAGVRGVIRKPYRFQDLFVQIQAVIEEHESVLS